MIVQTHSVRQLEIEENTRAFWQKAFLAAITGMGNQFNEKSLAEMAQVVADRATTIWTAQMDWDRR